MTDSIAPENTSQAAAWNGPNGDVWVAMQESLDRELEPLGEAAIAALRPQPGERIFDIGCGCGATTLALAQAVGPSGEAVGLDISAPMLSLARRRAAEAGLAQARFVEADAQVHRLDAAAYDGAFSRFGVMMFADPVAAFANLARALKPGGRLAFVCWRGPEENPSMSLPFAAAAHLLPPMPPADPLAPGPFAFADRERVLRILAEAGFAHPAAQAFDCQIGPGGLDESVSLYTQIGPVGRALRLVPEAAQAVSAAVREALLPYVTPEGVRLDAGVWLVTARRP